MQVGKCLLMKAEPLFCVESLRACEACVCCAFVLDGESRHKDVRSIGTCILLVDPARPGGAVQWSLLTRM